MLCSKAPTKRCSMQHMHYHATWAAKCATYRRIRNNLVKMQHCFILPAKCETYRRIRNKLVKMQHCSILAAKCETYRRIRNNLIKMQHVSFFLIFVSLLKKFVSHLWNVVSHLWNVGFIFMQQFLLLCNSCINVQLLHIDFLYATFVILWNICRITQHRNEIDETFLNTCNRNKVQKMQHMRIYATSIFFLITFIY